MSVKIILALGGLDDKGFSFKEREDLKVDAYIRPIHLKEMDDTKLPGLTSRREGEGTLGMLTYGTELRTFGHESDSFYKKALMECLPLLTAQETSVCMHIDNWVSKAYADQHNRMEKDIVADIINAVKFFNQDIAFSGVHADEIELHLVVNKDLAWNRELEDFLRAQG